MKIFHILPDNKFVCGGCKVHYQLAQLESELGYESFIVYKDTSKLPTWFKYHVRHITEAEMHRIAHKQRDLIVGWEDVEPLLRSGFANKVAYIQGEVFVQRNQPYHGITLWISSNHNNVSLPQFRDHPKVMVTPFIDSRVFHYTPENDTKRVTNILIQARKDGAKAVRMLMEAPNTHAYYDDLQVLLDIRVLPDCSEQQFAHALQQTRIFVAHSFPEGFGLPGLEAMACGCTVVGFTGGGGSDYMQHGDNCYIASPDGDYNLLSMSLRWALDMSPKDRQDMRAAADKTVAVYSRARTRQQLKAALSVYSEED